MFLRIPLRSSVYFVPLTALGLASTASAQRVVFSIDWKSPTVGAPNCTAVLPITEADLLIPCTGTGEPAFGGVPSPRIMIAGGGGPGSLGLVTYPGCVGHAGGTPCGVEVDALSFGNDFAVRNARMLAGTYVFSVDRCSFGVPSPLAPNVFSEAPVADAIADVFEDLGLPPGPVPPGGIVGNSGIIDGNGMPSGTGALYPGLGLFEPPVVPIVGLDNVDAIDMDVTAVTVAGPVYFSLDAFFPDPCLGVGNSATAVLNGFPAAAILASNLTGAPPVVYAAPALLGLDLMGPGRDDLDALAIHENGFPGYQPSAVPFDWLPGTTVAVTDMVLFSVRSGSAVIGLPDSNFGLPIEAGDILTTPRAPGLSPFPGIFIAAEWLGLRTTRTHGVVPADDLDALDTRQNPQSSLPYCFGDGSGGACPCGNFGIAGHGCANSIFPQGGLLQVSGSASVSADTIVLSGSFMPPSSALYFQGTGMIVPAPVFGDGLRCAGGNVVRLGTKLNTAGGTSQYPDVGDLPVSVKGMLPLAGGTRTYQCWYRNAAAFCTPATFNLTNGNVIVWTM